jgi:hypothetical protein
MSQAAGALGSGRLQGANAGPPQLRPAGQSALKCAPLLGWEDAGGVEGEPRGGNIGGAQLYATRHTPVGLVSCARKPGRGSATYSCLGSVAAPGTAWLFESRLTPSLS